MLFTQGLGYLTPKCGHREVQDMVPYPGRGEEEWDSLGCPIRREAFMLVVANTFNRLELVSGGDWKCFPTERRSMNCCL